MFSLLADCTVVSFKANTTRKLLGLTKPVAANVL